MTMAHTTLVLLLVGVVVVTSASYISPGAGVSDALLLRELVSRVGGGLMEPSDQYFGGYSSQLREPQSYGPSDLELRMLQMQQAEGRDQNTLDDEDQMVADELTIPRDIREDMELNMGGEVEGPSFFPGELAMHPSLRDREYMAHGHLLGNMLAQFPPGSSYGTMRIKPSEGDSPSVTTERKTEGVLPSYCNPPNPCPLGYTAADKCSESFTNTAAFSRSYQSKQECMCDTEHMFDCPDASRESEIGALARSIQNQGAIDSTLDKIIDEMRQNNPYLRGEKLPIAAKKGMRSI